MKLVLLGTGGYYANDRRHTACLLLPEVQVALDAGSAAYRMRHYLTSGRLDIFLSHAHLDHVIGLTHLVEFMTAEQLAQVTVHGEQVQLAAVEEHLFNPALFPVPPAFQTAALQASHPVGGGGVLRPFPLRHPGGSMGYRLDWPDRAMAYVTDTTAKHEAPYVEHIRGVDLLVHEANFADDQAAMAKLTGHSCLSAVARVAAQAEVGRLILVHLNTQLDDEADLDLAGMRRIFARTEVGHDRLEVEF